MRRFENPPGRSFTARLRNSSPASRSGAPRRRIGWDWLGQTDRLKAELPQMLAEHKAIVAELARLSDAARTEGRPEFARFAEKLILHATNEEQVLYPAATLVGEYLRLRLQAA